MKRIAAALALLLAGAGIASAQDQSFQSGAHPAGMVDVSGGAPSTIPRFSDADTITAGQCSDDGTNDISCPGIIDSDLTASRGLCVSGTKALESCAAGTSVQVSHGNASGQPTWGPVVSADMNITPTSCTNQFVTAVSAGGVGTCTTDTLASAQHANQGTTADLLIGNAAGNPSWGKAALATMVSGILSKANGGFGYAPATISSCSSTNLGTGGSPGCAVVSGNEHFAVLRITTGSSGAGTVGLLTINLGQTLPSAGGCFVLLSNSSTTWGAAATAKGNGTSATAPTVGWFNNGVALANSSSYDFWVFCNTPT